MDYIGRHFTKDGFDFGSLIDEDFVAPIRLLFQQGYYVSAAKLLMIFIDSVGYVDGGDEVKNPFVAWLTAYARLDHVTITADELWEQRNSLLHMSNLDSRKVTAGTVRRLMFYVGTLPTSFPADDTGTKYYNLQSLILV